MPVLGRKKFSLDTYAFPTTALSSFPKDVDNFFNIPPSTFILLLIS
jgi:hypothetical protein